ncbi:predicted protein [Botrytis cinerea T4]|uniref:Uncharacterized protein n=1 Tax=Botryotinia fuckeliana (strain T4) TaxID=999810 RepID=G2YT81_BOTF4|nr:predicted protein [Botrytis cinerea T4]
MAGNRRVHQGSQRGIILCFGAITTTHPSVVISSNKNLRAALAEAYLCDQNEDLSPFGAQMNQCEIPIGDKKG